MKAFKIEEIDFIDKSLTILMYISANCNKSNLSKQALTSILSNTYCFKELLSVIKYFGINPPDYEAQFNLLFEILSIFLTTSINNSKVGVFLLQFGGLLYDILLEIQIKKESIYNNEMQESSLPRYDAKFSSFMNLLMPCSFINSSSKSINYVMDLLNDACFTSVQKYNLHNFEKPISENNFKDSIKDYIQNMKMNLLEYRAQDAYFLGDLDDKNSLINKIYLNLRVINTSVSYNKNKFNFFIRWYLIACFL